MASKSENVPERIDQSVDHFYPLCDWKLTQIDFGIGSCRKCFFKVIRKYPNTDFKHLLFGIVLHLRNAGMKLMPGVCRLLKQKKQKICCKNAAKVPQRNTAVSLCETLLTFLTQSFKKQL